MGRYGSKNVRLPIQEPLTPSMSKMSGPAQQMPAPTAAINTPISGRLVSFWGPVEEPTNLTSLHKRPIYHQF